MEERLHHAKAVLGASSQRWGNDGDGRDIRGIPCPQERSPAGTRTPVERACSPASLHGNGDGAGRGLVPALDQPGRLLEPLPALERPTPPEIGGCATRWRLVCVASPRRPPSATLQASLPWAYLDHTR